jgi:CheY-like chemotaxis protein
MAVNVKVLLVDDNPMVLGMLQHSLSTLAQVTTAPDGAEALLKAIDDPPDLLIADYSMQGMDGRQLAEKIKARPQTARTSIVLLAGKTDISDKLRTISDFVDDFIEKPFFLNDAVSRLKRTIDRLALEKMARESNSTVLRGSLQQMGVIDLVQSLEMGRKTCSLKLTHNGESCEMFFSDGQISHAKYGSATGDAAVYRALTWSDGNFVMDFDGRSSEQTTTRSTQGLLMEGLRLLDESNRDASEDNVLDA